MKFKKTGCFILVFMMVLSLLLAGCKKDGVDEGQGKTTAADSGETKQDGKTEKTEDDSNMIGNMYKTGLPIVKEKVTLKVVAKLRAIHGDFNEMPVLKELEEKTNVHIEWDQIPSEMYNEKKSLLLAGGDLPDAFFGPWALKKEDLYNFGPNGTFIAIEELIKQYAPNLTEIFKTHPLTKKVATLPDGHIYGTIYAQMNGLVDGRDNMFMYKPWLEKLNLKVPDSIDEFYEVLKAFKTQDPNENGKPDEIPFSFMLNHPNCSIYSLYGMFGRVDNKDHMVVEDDRIIYTPMHKEWMQGTQYFHKLFKEGLFDEEALVHDYKMYTSKGKTPEVILGSYITWNDFDVAGMERKDDYVIVPPMKGISGERIWGEFRRGNGGIQPTAFVITKENKYPEVSIRWVDHFYDKETSLRARYGPSLIDNGDGTYNLDDKAPEGMSKDEHVFSLCPGGDAPMALFIEDYGKLIPRDAASKKKFDDIEKYYRPYMTGKGLPGFHFTIEESQRVQILQADIDPFINQNQAKWLMDGGIEDEWDGFVDKLKKMNIEEYIKIHQDAYDRFLNVE